MEVNSTPTNCLSTPKVKDCSKVQVINVETPNATILHMNHLGINRQFLCVLT